MILQGWENNVRGEAVDPLLEVEPDVDYWHFDKTHRRPLKCVCNNPNHVLVDIQSDVLPKFLARSDKYVHGLGVPRIDPLPCSVWSRVHCNEINGTYS